MKRRNHAIIFFIFALQAFFAGSVLAESTKGKTGGGVGSYSFAVIPYYAPEKIWTLFSPLVEYLRDKTNQDWKLQLYSNHEEFISDMCSGKISVALAGPIPLGRAYNKCGVRPLLVAKGKNGKPVYHSVLVTNDPGVRDLGDLKGRKIGLFRGSTAAHILPMSMLKKAGVPAADIQTVFLEGQDRIVAALLAGELSAAGMKESLFRKIAKQNLRILATSEDVPNFALAALPSFPEKVRRQLVNVLLNVQPLTNKRDAETVKSWDDEVKNGFVEPDRTFLPAILNLYSTYWEITNEPR